MNCASCDKPIPPERLEALPNATRCVPCVVKDGDVPHKVGRMSYSHKTAGEIEIMDSHTLAEMNRLDPRGYNKKTLREDNDD